MSPRSAAALIALAAACPSCSDEKPSQVAAAEVPSEGHGRPLLGIMPDKWKCTDVVSDAEIGDALGGEARPIEGQFTMPRGVAQPCNYVVALAGGGAPDAGPAEEAWSFDLDCRKGYDKTAARLFEEYARRAADTVSAYAETTTGPGKPRKGPTDDAGVPLKAPTGSHEVAVGKKALDHGGVALLFVDDDAPCYVRVNGPDAERRLALATLVASRLREANAPMPPHAEPAMPAATP